MAVLTVVPPVIFLVLCFQVRQALAVVWCDAISYCQDGYYCCYDDLCCQSMSVGAIVGLVFGIALLLGLAIGFWCWRRNRSRAPARVVVVTTNAAPATAPPS